VYAHGTGTVISTDIYETKQTDGTAVVTYAAGDKLYASQNGLLTNASGLNSTVGDTITLIGIVLKVPTASDLYMTFQMKI